MQPEINQAPTVAPEQLITPPVNSGEVPVLPPLVEGNIETGTAERREQLAEASAAVSDASAVQSASQATPTVNSPSVTTSTVTSPTTANDDDVIEKEWVDKAKEIILATADDPFTRTNQVNQLQRDYLKKRYNKDVGAG